MANCYHINPIVKGSGSSQNSRLLPSLDPKSAPIMDKDPLDWMVWGSRISSVLRYYNSSNLVDGNMEPFFAADLAARLAMVATHPIDTIPDFVRAQLFVLHDHSNHSKTALLRRCYTQLFDIILGYASRIDDLHKQLTLLELQQPELLTDIDFLLQLRTHIRLRLNTALSLAISYYKASISANLTGPTPEGAIEVFQCPISNSEAVISNGLTEIWWNGKASWNDYLNSIGEESSIFGSESTVYGKIQHASHHNFFTGLCDEVASSSAFLVKHAKLSVNKLLGDWPYHEPHYALYLSWLKLLEHARTGMNKLTGRHLDFYYERVLRLNRIPAQADKAFLSLELNKATESTAIKKDTAFIGGKDSNGKEILYTATRETVINQTTVDKLQSIYFSDAKDLISGVSQEGLLFASPVPNSKDGIGGKLSSSLGEWHPFYIKAHSEGELKSIDMPWAQVGFAISSHYLRLNEGKRKIVVKLQCNDNSVLVNKKVKVYITVKKEWLYLGEHSYTSGKLNDNITTAATLSLNVAADNPAITAYDVKKHGHYFDTKEPVLKLLLPNDLANASAYHELLGLTLEQIDLEVQVGEMTGAFNNEGLKNLKLQNDSGVINAAKPFLPFGNEPTPGNALIIGNEELFCKSNTQFQLNLEWKDLPDEFSQMDFDYYSDVEYPSVKSTNGPSINPEIDLEALESGRWVTKSSKLNLFPVSGSSFLPNAAAKTSEHLSGKMYHNPLETYGSFDSKSVSGFMRLKLKQDFGHRNYHQAKASYLLEKALGTSGIHAPFPPYNPVLQSLSISYNSQCSIIPGNSSNPAEYWHIAPFGDAIQENESLTLLPGLTISSSPIKAQGSLFIGLKNADPDSTVSLLFQLMEGSENPLSSKPKKHIIWSYLSENAWEPFEDDSVDDGTSQLIRSGIIKFTLPKDASDDNTLMSTGLTWLRAQVQEAPDAVCKIIGIHTNAIEVERQQSQGGKMDSLVSSSGAISKLRIPDGKVKKVNQPYASFGGRTLESGDEYYVRVSERLRHKDRAVTIWDYERLILQEFKEIYKVKCLNHTKLEGSVSDGDLEYNEAAPGHVTVITIPDLKQRNDMDPLKPYTKKSTLEAIETYLKKRVSCHVKLSAQQPQFEEVRMAAKVVLLSGYDDATYYTQLLQQELTEYLSPWAFNKKSQPDFGGSIHKSVLIDFLEELAYVDYLTDVKLYHTPGEGASESADLEEVVASTARSVLVSAQASKHSFDVLTAKSLPTQKANCKDE